MASSGYALPTRAKKKVVDYEEAHTDSESDGSESDFEGEDEDDYDEDEDEDEDDYSGYSRSPSKSRKSVSLSSPTKLQSAPPKTTSRLPGAGPWNPKFVLQDGKVAKHKNRKDMNISAGYGKVAYWPRSAGLRELIQNMFDGALSSLRAMEGDSCTARDIEARLVCSSRANINPLQAPRSLQLQYVPAGETVSFTLHYKPYSTRKSSPSKKRKKEGPPLGWVSFKSDGYARGHIELYNGGDTLDFDCMTFGYSSKAGEVGFIGQHGDGMKMGINAIIREERGSYRAPPSVHYVTGKHHWDFLYCDGVLEAHQTSSRFKVNGVLTQVTDFPCSEINFGTFLFLCPPKECLEADLTGEKRVGAILLDEELRHNIYVKGVFVQKRSKHGGLKYGVDIWSNVQISRDRVGLENDATCAAATYAIWESLFVTSERARKLYLDILITDHESIETRHIEHHLERPEAILLLRQLRDDQGRDAFFYYATDTIEPIRIIEQVLKKRAVWIPENFHNALLKHRLIKTPEAARIHRFRSLESSPHYDMESPQMRYTAHLIQAFLNFDEEMSSYQNTFSFKAAPVEMGIEIVVDENKVLLHELTLSPVWVHSKSLFRMCTRYKACVFDRVGAAVDLEAVEGGEEDGQEEKCCNYWPEVSPENMCHCAALYVLHLITQENSNIRLTQKQEMSMGRQLALRSIPRNIKFEPIERAAVAATGDDSELDMVLSWVTDDDVTGFDVVITNGAVEEPLLTKDSVVVNGLLELTNGATESGEIDDKRRVMGYTKAFAVAMSTFHRSTELVQPKNPSNSHRSRELKQSSLIVNNLTPGQKYFAQICWMKDGAIFCPPFSFDIPPLPPPSSSIAAVITLDGELSVLWEVPEGSGADAWLVTVSKSGEQIFESEVEFDTPRCQAHIDFQDVGAGYTLWIRVFGLTRTLGGIRSASSASHTLVVEPSPPPPPPEPMSPHPDVDIEMPAQDDDSDSDSSASPPLRTSFPSIRRSRRKQTARRGAKPPSPATPHSATVNMDRAPTLRRSPTLEYVDNEHTLGLMRDLDYDFPGGFGSDDGSEDGGDGLGDAGVDVEKNPGNGPSEKETAVATVPPLLRPSQNEILAKPWSIPPGNDYFNPKSTFAGTQRLVTDQHYLVDLRGSDGNTRTNIITITAIEIPKDPQDETDVTILSFTQYIEWKHYQADAPATEIALVVENAESSVKFRISDVVKVHCSVSIGAEAIVGESDGGSKYFCKWGVQRTSCSSYELAVIPVTFGTRRLADEPLEAPASLELIDIVSGAGGVSCGFKEAGFSPRCSVEPNTTLAYACDVNSSADVYNESLESFYGRTWTGLEMATIFVNEARAGLHLRPFVEALKTLKPAYAVCNVSSTGAAGKLQLQVMELGYSSAIAVLNAANYGMAFDSTYTVLIASAPGRSLPAFPASTHADQKLALKDVIADLDWTNPTCLLSEAGLSTMFAHPRGVDQPVSGHCTGCVAPEADVFANETTVAEWENSLPALFKAPSADMKCRHPRYPERYLTVREMARIASFPDDWKFVGTVRSQYYQIAKSFPPKLACVIASEIRKVMGYLGDV